MSQLPADCLNDIFECLEEDKITLHSCLLVNRLWCRVSVKILWTSVWNYDTLIACLPNESKEILYKSGTINPTPTSKPPLFNYIAFIKNLELDNIIKIFFGNSETIFYDKDYIVLKEIYKLFNQISSLRELRFYSSTIKFVSPTPCLGTSDCLKHLSKLSCRSDIYPQFFYELSQKCQNIQSLKIYFIDYISNRLADLISAQKNLKHLSMSQIDYIRSNRDLTYIITSLMKHSNTLVKLYIDELERPLSFIAKLTNLQELVLSYYYGNAMFEDFKTLQYVHFPRLQILNFKRKCLGSELFTKFLEINGKNLKELHVNQVTLDNKLLNLAIAQFCSNLRILHIAFKDDTLGTLENIFNNCQYLESIEVWSNYEYDAKTLFENDRVFTEKFS